MSRLLTVAGVQMFVQFQDVEANLRTMEEQVAFISRSYPYVDVILFPELAMYGAPFADWKNAAIEIPGKVTDRLARLAKKYRKWLIPGSFFERTSEGVYNTAIVLSDTGELVTRYRKLYPWRPLEQTLAGSDFCVFDIPDVGRIGLCICYDMWVPEVCRTLSWMGAEVILHPTMTTSQDREQELILSRANAIFNQLYFLDVNGAGWGGNGGSLFVDPHGRILQRAGESPAILIETIDLEEVTRSRQTGVAGVSQILRQFVNTPLEFPVYADVKGGEGFQNLTPPAVVRNKST